MCGMRLVIGKIYMLRTFVAVEDMLERFPNRSIDSVLVSHHIPIPQYQSKYTIPKITKRMSSTMSSTKPLVLVIGGTGVQGMPVVKGKLHSINLSTHRYLQIFPNLR